MNQEEEKGTPVPEGKYCLSLETNKSIFKEDGTDIVIPYVGECEQSKLLIGKISSFEDSSKQTTLIQKEKKEPEEKKESGGFKLDQGKNRLELISPYVTEEVIKMFDLLSSKKLELCQNVEDPLLQWEQGIEFDKSTGISNILLVFGAIHNSLCDLLGQPNKDSTLNMNVFFGELPKILTFGAIKYPGRNWEKGMNWTRCIGALKRHLYEHSLGNLIDPESKCYHLSHALCNVHFLIHFTKYHPKFDDRPHWKSFKPKIGLDLDCVLVDFIPPYNKRFSIETAPNCWDYDPKIVERLESLKDDESFWVNLPVLTKPEDIPFEPDCYITSRICPEEFTKKWLEKNNFPCRPLIQIKPGEKKIKICQ